MTTTQFILFLALLCLPALYQRIRFFRNKSFLPTCIGRSKGLQIHHGHWGLGFVFITSMLMALGYTHIWTILLTAYGWGLILDEIVPALKMPTVGREIELQVYGRANTATFVIIGAIMVILIVLRLIGLL